MNTNLQLRWQKPSLKEVLPDPRLVKPNPTLVPMGRLLMLVAKRPRQHHKEKEEASDSDTSLKSKKDDKESHSDSFTDS